MFGTGVADYALEPRYTELLWEVSAEMVAAEKYSRATYPDAAPVASGYVSGGVRCQCF
jgi:hypothetical protein